MVKTFHVKTGATDKNLINRNNTDTVEFFIDGELVLRVNSQVEFDNWKKWNIVQFENGLRVRQDRVIRR